MPSTAAGFLVPVTGQEPTADADLDNAIHGTIHGVIGRIDKTLVRPRWVPEPANQPLYTTNWVAFGVIRSEVDNDSWHSHEDAGELDDNEGTDIVEHDELLYVLLSFYGPQASGNAARFRSGIDIAQNRVLLLEQGIGLVEVQNPVKVPALMNQLWVPRVDTTLVLRRRSVTRYEIRSLKDATGMLDNEMYLTPLKIDPPAP